MKKLQNIENKIILGYHNKNINQYGIIESDQLPILIKEDYNPFLVTRDYNFTITTKRIKTLLKNYKIIKSFNNTKRTLATLLIIPGLLISLLYALKFFNTLPALTTLISTKLTLIAFWTSVLGVLMIWHDYYRYKSHPVELPKIQPISTKEQNSIKTDGFKFARYIQLNPINFLSEESKNLLEKNYKNGYFKSVEFLKDLLEIDHIQEILKRTEIKLKPKDFTEIEINSNTLPDYPISAIRSLILYAAEDALLTTAEEIKPEHLLCTFVRIFPVLKEYVSTNNSSPDLIREIIYYYTQLEHKEKQSNIFNPKVPYYPKGGIGKYWIYGHTFILNKFSTDLNEKMANETDQFGIGHKKEIEEMISVLGRLSQKNVLLIGEAGVGKSSLIKGLAQKIINGKVSQQLLDKRIIQLNITNLLAHGSKKGNIEVLIKKAMDELAKAGNTILYIDEIQELIPAKSGDSNTSIASIMLPYILESNFPIIGTINYSSYKKYFYDNESLRNSFENVEISELSPYETLQILKTLIKSLESNYNLYISFPALTTAIELSQRYINNRKLPDSAVRTIEATCSWAQTQKIKVLTSEHVAKYISIQTDIPVESISSEEADKLMSLENKIRERVIGQNEAVHKVVETLKRARTDIRDPDRPIGTFLFMGPTGVGKTHLAKITSEEYFNAEKGKADIITVDMSEYKNLDSVDKFLGQYNEDGLYSQSAVSLLDKVKENPYSVLLFDEIEKTHPQILDLFLQLFEEGRLTSNKGESVDFTNTIIICTSNIGSKILLESLSKEQALWKEAKERAIIELRQAMKPELINRFDEVIVFAPHSKENLIKIAEILLSNLATRISGKGYEIEWKDTIPVLIANKAYEPGFGARPLRRYIQEKIESQIASQILKNEINKGDTIEIKSEWV